MKYLWKIQIRGRDYVSCNNKGRNERQPLDVVSKHVHGVRSDAHTHKLAVVDISSVTFSASLSQSRFFRCVTSSPFGALDGRSLHACRICASFLIPPDINHR